MANYNVSVTSSSFYDPEVGTQRFTNINPSSVTLKTGDTLTVTYTQQSGGQSYVDITSFASGFWNSTANARLYNGNSVVRTLLASSGSDGVVANFPYYLFTDRTCTVTATPNIDTTPDNFTLGDDIINADRSTVYQSSSVTVSGIDTPITASVTNSAVFTVNNTSYSSATSANKTVSNGDVIRVWMTSSPNYLTSLNTTLSLNGVTDYWQVRTIAQPLNPQDGTIIPLGISSGSISMLNLRDLFGRPTYQSDTISMSDLYNGGNLVPSITQNSSIPTSGAISLSNFYNSSTSFMFEKQPPSKQIEEFSTQATGTMQAQWVMNITPTGQGDFDIGYGMLKSSALEYRWIITGGNQLTRMVIDGVGYTTSSSSYTSSWGNTGTLQLERDWYSANTSFDIFGTAKLEVRKVYNGNTYTIQSASASWQLHKFNSIE